MQTFLSNLANKYKTNDVKLNTLALGASYDPGQWFATTELVAFNGEGFLSDSRSWYVTGGYRFGAFTPYVTYAKTRANWKTEGALTATGDTSVDATVNALRTGINAAITGSSGRQHMAAIGVRWDVMRNLAIKTQYERVTTEDGSNGRFIKAKNGFGGNSANLISLTADFVF